LDRPVSVVDFAPTVAELLGVGEIDFDGSPIEALTEKVARIGNRNMA
jgi:hypothetical protein